MLVALGITLVIAGAIITFAIDAQVDGADIAAIGWILMAGGAFAIIAGAIRGASFMTMGNKRIQHERHVSDDGQHVVEQSKIS